jgi:hypothetical protein
VHAQRLRDADRVRHLATHEQPKYNPKSHASPMAHPLSALMRGCCACCLSTPKASTKACSASTLDVPPTVGGPDERAGPSSTTASTNGSAEEKSHISIVLDCAWQDE